MSDLIRREDVIRVYEKYHPTMAVDVLDFEKELKAIPNAETTGALDDAIQEYIKDGYILAEPTVGKWIEHPNHIECPNCKVWFLKKYMPRNSYCPNCGAKMEENDG